MHSTYFSMKITQFEIKLKQNFERQKKEEDFSLRAQTRVAKFYF